MLTWPPEILPSILPHRHSHAPLRSFDLPISTCNTRITKQWQKVCHHYHTRQHPDIPLQDALHWLEQGGSLTPTTQALAIVLTGAAGREEPHRGPYYWSAHIELVDAFLSLWMQEQGPQFVMDTLVAAQQYQPAYTTTDLWRDIAPFQLSTGNQDPVGFDFMPGLGAVLQASTEADYQKILATFRLAPLSPHSKAMFLLAMPEATEITESLLHNSIPLEPRALTSPEAAIAQIKRLKTHLFHNRQYEYVASFVDRMQEKSVLLLEEMLSLIDWNQGKVEVARALTWLNTAEAAEVLVKAFLLSRDVQAVVRDWAQSNPELAFPALSAASARTGRLGLSIRPLLLRLCSPARISQLIPSLQSHILALQQKITPGPELPHEKLPKVLADPPWLKSRSFKRPVIRTLTPLPLAEQTHFTPKESEHFIESMRRFAIHRSCTLAELMEAGQAGKNPPKAYYAGEYGYSLMALSEKDALIAWNTLPAACFSMSGEGVLEMVLARHGAAALPGLLRHYSQKPVATLRVLGRLESPAIAGLFAQALTGRAGKRDAEAWLCRFVDAACCGLWPIALGEPGKSRLQAEGALRFLAREGFRTKVETWAERYGILSDVAGVLDIDPRSRVPKKPGKLPDWVAVERLSRPQQGDFSMPSQAVIRLIEMLQFCDYEEPYPGIFDVKEAFSAESLEQFSFDLFLAWEEAGANPKDLWALQQLGLLGGDFTARQLFSLIQLWPGESLQARAVVGLDILGQIGSDKSLMYLDRLGSRLRFKGVQERARERIAEVAESRGLSALELGDRLVPDLGLSMGRVSVLCGEKEFFLEIGEDLGAYVLDAAGHTFKDLPGKDAAISKAFRKDLKEIIRLQLVRLEDALISGRSLERELWQTCFVEHPIVGILARRLLWGFYQGDRLYSAFRVDESGALEDKEEQAVVGAGLVRLVHPVELSEEERQQWVRIFSDYKIIQPFEQLQRAFFRDEVVLTGRRLPTGKIQGLLQRGWAPGEPGDSGGIWSIVWDGVTVGLVPGLNSGAETQELAEIEGVPIPGQRKYSELIRFFSS